MNVLETEWWSVAIPPEWWAESEEDSILIGDRDGVGCIEVSTLHSEGEDTPVQGPEAMARDASGELDWTPVSLGDFDGVAAGSLEEGTALREWYVANGRLLLYITYSCDEDNRGMDDAAVDELLDTLAVLPAASPEER